MNTLPEMLKARKYTGTRVIVLLLMLTVPFMSGCEKQVEISLRSDVPDFKSIAEVKEKKVKFFAFIQPFVDERNEEIIAKRNRLLALYNDYLNKTPLSVEEKNWLDALAKEYKLNKKKIAPDTRWILLLRRVDIVPLELALVQAAKESGWGTSRFARVGYNLFGQQCFKKGCGIIPQGRAEGATHEVATFNSARDSVRSYMRNLNTSTAFHDFRTIRFTIRENGNVPSGYDLVPGLPLYSERRDEYLVELQDLILANRKFMGS